MEDSLGSWAGVGAGACQRMVRKMPLEPRIPELQEVKNGDIKVPKRGCIDLHGPWGRNDYLLDKRKQESVHLLLMNPLNLAIPLLFPRFFRIFLSPLLPTLRSPGTWKVVITKAQTQRKIKPCSLPNMKSQWILLDKYLSYDAGTLG